MKKAFIIAACAILAVAGCKQLTNAEKAAAYQEACENLQAEYYASMTALQSDSTLTEEQIMEKAEAVAADFENQFKTLALTTIKKNPKDSVALDALRDAFYMAEPEELQEAVDCISDELKQDKLVQRIMQGLAAKMATREGSAFVDFTVQHVSDVDKDGAPVYQELKLSDYVGKGKYVLVDFWSPWCPPCKAELPNIKKVYETYAGEKFDVLSVAVWEQSRRMDWHNTIDTAKVYGITWNQMNNAGQEPADLYGIDGIPHVILFGPDGTILKRDLRGEELAAAVAEALGVNE